MNDLRVITGDCMEVMKALKKDGEMFRAVITDPPYQGAIREFAGEGKGAYDTDVPPYRTWLPLAKKLLRPGGALFVWEMPQNLEELQHEAMKIGFSVLHTIVWYAPDRYSFTKASFWSKYDVCMYAVLGPMKWRDWDKSGMPDAICAPVVKNDFAIPGAKPLDVMRPIVKVCTKPGERILDPFLGSGTTLVAAAEQGRTGVGIEIREDIAEMARSRVANVASQWKF